MHTCQLCLRGREGRAAQRQGVCSRKFRDNERFSTKDGDKLFGEGEQQEPSHRDREGNCGPPQGSVSRPIWQGSRWKPRGFSVSMGSESKVSSFILQLSHSIVDQNHREAGF